MNLDDYIRYLIEDRGMDSKTAYYEALDTIDKHSQSFDLVIEKLDFWHNTSDKLLSEIRKMTTDGARYEETNSDYPNLNYEDYEKNPSKYEAEFDRLREEARTIVANYYQEHGIDYSQAKSGRRR